MSVYVVDFETGQVRQLVAGANIYFSIGAGTFTVSASSGTITDVIAGAGLTGGGSSGAVTLDVGAGDGSIVVSADSIAVGVISDAQHGSLGGGSLHAVATPSVAGFESAADKAALDALIAAPVATDMSVQGTGTAGNKVKLVNDETSPGASKIYGTDGAGVKGWQTGGDDVTKRRTFFFSGG